jgi:hypothetical protein
MQADLLAASIVRWSKSAIWTEVEAMPNIPEKSK